MLLQPKLDHNTRQMGTFPYSYHYHYSHTFLCIGFLNVCQVCAKGLHWIITNLFNFEHTKEAARKAKWNTGI